jgi:hypothetical protein
VLVPGFHGGMFDHNTIRVLTTFCSVSLTFDHFFRQAMNDSSKGATMMIIRAIALLSKGYYSFLLFC